MQQFIEFGNRMLTFVLVAATVLLFLAVLRAGRRKEIIVLAVLNALGVVVQAVIGGISVLVDLKWYAVALHFLPSMLLTFLAAMLYVKIAEADDGTPTRLYPRYFRYLAMGATAALTITLITGSMVTGAGPHAGDAEVLAEDRLQIPLIDMTHIHAGFMYLFLGLSIGILVGLLNASANSAIRKINIALIVLIILQGIVGMIQYWTGVPAVLVPVHVAGSGAITAMMGLLFQWGYRYTGGQSTLTGSPLGDAALAERKAEVKA